MDDLIIKPTKNTPFVSFKANGELLLEGRSYPGEPIRFYEPVIQWAEGLKGKVVRFEVKLEYFNTSTCKYLLTLVRLLYENNGDENVTVYWFYEVNDTEVQEIGEHLENIVGKKFIYQTY